jgi:hypothetical protein
MQNRLDIGCSVETDVYLKHAPILNSNYLLEGALPKKMQSDTKSYLGDDDTPRKSSEPVKIEKEKIADELALDVILEETDEDLGSLKSK